MRYDEYDDYNRRYSKGNSRSGGTGYDRERGRSGYDRSGRSEDRGRYDRGYEDRYDRNRSYDEYDRDRSYRSGYDRDRGYSGSYDREYDRRSGQSYDRYGGRSRPRYDSNFDRENWNRTAPNWVDHSEPEPRRRSGSDRYDQDRYRGERDRGRDPDRERDRRRSSSRSDSRRDGGRRSSGDRRRSGERSRSRQGRSGINPVPIIAVVCIIAVLALVAHHFLGGGGKDKFEISFSNQSIVVGETAEATLNGVPSGSNPTVIWSSSDNNVVSVSGEGVVCSLSAKSAGQATIAATIDGKTVDSGVVMVVETAPGVTAIRLEQEEVTVVSGSEYTIQATVVMEKDDMTPARINWTSADSSIARVSDGGVVTGGQVGQTIIKGTAGEKTAELVVKVVENTENPNYDASQITGEAPEEGSETTAAVDEQTTAVLSTDSNTTAASGSTETGTVISAPPVETEAAAEPEGDPSGDGAATSETSEEPVGVEE